MKFYATTAALVGAVMACILVTVAAADRMTVTATDESSSWKFGEIVLNLDYYDDGRNQPYVIVLSKDDIDSSWNFRADFSIKRFQIDSDKYRVAYSGETIKKVVHLNPSRRQLTAEEEAVVKEEPDRVVHPHRRLTMGCDVCYEMWSLMCDSNDYGYNSVLKLVESGYVPSGDPTTAAEYLKEGIYWACYQNFDHDGDRRFDVACDGQCV